jgi:nicotinamide-nucleotide amidase
LLGHRLTNVPGSSDYFLEGVVAYSTEAKISLLAVAPSLLAKHGAVSFETARAMARSIRQRAGSDYGLAITGIAGPAGGTPQKPVGLVFTALDSPEGTEVRENVFLGSRHHVKYQSAQEALDMLRRRLLGLPIVRGQRRKK